ncbi:MAG: transglycosylase SLT domain-containing protein [Deltaproteobacteria bacterium]|nr:transglycosylase SLT domain-containing protein [Deltaproteobacteria bacterium]
MIPGALLLAIASSTWAADSSPASAPLPSGAAARALIEAGALMNGAGAVLRQANPAEKTIPQATPTSAPVSGPALATSAPATQPVLASGPLIELPVVDHPDVQRWIRYFLGPGADRFSRWLERYGRYAPMMRAMLREQGLPEDVVYLAMIESGFAPRAYSRARAVGPWQFVAATGARYGLKQDFWVDERRDPVKATRAAASHLRDLYDEFGDWHLAWAAYNAGANKIRRAIDRYGTSDYFELRRHSYLRRETKQYVPKLMAAIVIARDPARYGFVDITPLEPFGGDMIDVDDATDLGLIARGCECTVEELSELNPELLRWATPPVAADEVPYQLRVPHGLGDACQNALDAIPEQERLTFRRHQVRRGEFPGRIAARYGITTEQLLRVNQLPGARRLVVGSELLIPIPEHVPDHLVKRDPVVQRRGDAGERGLKTSARGRSATTLPAELVPASATSRAATANAGQATSRPGRRPLLPAPQPAGTRAITHVLQQGENLWLVAQQYGVDVRDLRAWNAVRRVRSLLPGQALVVYVPADQRPPKAMGSN